MVKQTVVGLFPSASEAQQAVQNLTAAGFADSNVDVATQGALQAQRLAAGISGAFTESPSDGIGRFFSRLFGLETHEEVPADTSATHNGHSLVTVTAASVDAERARRIMHEHGALDVHEYAARPGAAIPGREASMAEGRARMGDLQANEPLSRRPGDETSPAHNESGGARQLRPNQPERGDSDFSLRGGISLLGDESDLDDNNLTSR